MANARKLVLTGILSGALPSFPGRAGLEAEGLEGGGERHALQVEADSLTHARRGNQDLPGEELVQARGELYQREPLTETSILLARLRWRLLPPTLLSKHSHVQASSSYE